MAQLAQKILSFIKSPRGQRLVEQGKRELAKPGTKEKLGRVTARFARRR
jgi:hypothetical protein